LAPAALRLFLTHVRICRQPGALPTAATAARFAVESAGLRCLACADIARNFPGRCAGAAGDIPARTDGQAGACGGGATWAAAAGAPAISASPCSQTGTGTAPRAEEAVACV